MLMKRGDSHLLLLIHYLGLNLGEVLPAIGLQRPFSVWGSTGFPPDAEPLDACK